MSAVNDEVRTFHVIEMAFEDEGLGLLHRPLHRTSAEYGLDMVGKTMVFLRASPQLRYRPDCTMGEGRRRPIFVTACARRVISAKRRTADRDLRRIDILARQEIVDALADRHLVVRPGGNLVTTQRAALSRAVDHEDRD